MYSKRKWDLVKSISAWAIKQIKPPTKKAKKSLVKSNIKNSVKWIFKQYVITKKCDKMGKNAKNRGVLFV